MPQLPRGPATLRTISARIPTVSLISASISFPRDISAEYDFSTCWTMSFEPHSIQPLDQMLIDEQFSPATGSVRTTAMLARQMCADIPVRGHAGIGIRMGSSQSWPGCHGFATEFGEWTSGVTMSLQPCRRCRQTFLYSRQAPGASLQTGLIMACRHVWPFSATVQTCRPTHLPAHSLPPG